MSCETCDGYPWLCETCQMEELEDRWGVPDDHFQTADERRDRDRDELQHECTACGERYRTDGSDPCPECGARRRRYVGPLEGSA